MSSSASASFSPSPYCVKVYFCLFPSDSKTFDFQKNIVSTRWVDPKLTTIGEMNLSFGRLGMGNSPLPRRLAYKGAIYPADTLVHDLLEPGQTEITFYFVWNAEHEVNSVVDQSRIDNYLDELEMQAEGDDFVLDNELYDWETDTQQLYTAQEHAERGQSTMEMAKAAQAKCLNKHAWGHEMMATVRKLEEKHRKNMERIERLRNIIPKPAKIERPKMDGDTVPAFSVCIPRVFSSITERRIRKVFWSLGFPEISAVDMIECDGTDKRTGEATKHNRVFIHFVESDKQFYPKELYANVEKIFNGEEIKVLYDKPWFWKISLNTSRRPTVPNFEE